MRQLAWISACATILLEGSPASACPLCVSETGRRVRAGIFNSDFGANLVMTLLPFPVFVAVVALIYFGPPWPRARPMETLPSDDGGRHRGRAH